MISIVMKKHGKKLKVTLISHCPPHILTYFRSTLRNCSRHVVALHGLKLRIEIYLQTAEGSLITEMTAAKKKTSFKRGEEENGISFLELEMFTESLQEIQAELQESYLVWSGGTQQQLGRQVALWLAFWKSKFASASATDFPM